MNIYIIIKSGYYNGSRIIGVFDNRDKAEDAVKLHITEQDGWCQTGNDEWQNDDYMRHIMIQGHEVK